MPGEGNGSGASEESLSRSRNLSGVLAQGGIRISVDLVPAARRHLSFLTKIANSPWLHHPSTLLQAIRRYDELWMPLISDLAQTSSKRPPSLLPPLDIEWVWHCHCLQSSSYRSYCETRFSMLVERPSLFDDENREYAESRCRELWAQRYPSEPFDPDDQGEGSTAPEAGDDHQGIWAAVSKYGSLYKKFSEPYVSELVYLITARRRYKGFLHLLQAQGDGGIVRLVPTSDILLMWLTHRSFPSTYAADMQGVGSNTEKVAGIGEVTKDEAVNVTKNLWETTFDRPYEKAGATFERIFSDKSPIFWGPSDVDVNDKYKSLVPRFMLEVCIFLKGQCYKADVKVVKNTFIRLRMARCHRELKLDIPILDAASEAWQKTWQLYCELGTRGALVEIRRQGGACFRNRKVRKIVTFLWNDLLRSPSLTLERPLEGTQMRVVTSITPPVQAPYLLKCVPDRVTDDGGAMISDVILKMSQYRPQEGRWLSRTVLDHAGRECFVIRIRMGGGFWRRGAETPSAVRWEERIIEVREGSWSYIAGTVGRVPEKVVGTAVPKQGPEEKAATWCLSTGYVLTIDWEGGLTFHLQSENSDEDLEVRLLKGRKLQYRGSDNCSNKKQENKEEDEDGFVTLVRYTSEKPDGKATALLNWKLLVAELSPEEDAVTVLLLCMIIVRSFSESRREDVGRLLVRRREKEVKLGKKDWGSVMLLHPSSLRSDSSIHVKPWYWNAKEVFELPKGDYMRQQTYNYSPADGGEGLYKLGILFKDNGEDVIR